MKKFTILYANTSIECLAASNLLAAQKAAHSKAAKKKTIVISVTENK